MMYLCSMYMMDARWIFLRNCGAGSGSIWTIERVRRGGATMVNIYFICADPVISKGGKCWLAIECGCGAFTGSDLVEAQ